MTGGILQWLSQDPSSEKHKGWSHPMAACIIHYVVAIAVTFSVHDVVISFFNDIDTGVCPLDRAKRQQTVASFVALYSAWLLAWRLWHAKDQRNSVLYEYTFLCNVTLVVGATSLYWNRPLVATAHCVAVSIDQVLWYVDLLGWALSNFRKFPLGVAKYITWPETSWVTRITCTHHLWTIPLLVYGSGGLHAWSFPLSVVIVIVNVCLSRWLTPFVIVSDTDKRSVKYLNINVSHELWKDIKIKIVQINYDNPPTLLYLFRLLWRWQLLNLAVFALLYETSYRIFGQAVISCATGT